MAGPSSSVSQIEYSLIQRSVEPELMMARAFGMTVTWWALCRGRVDRKIPRGEQGRITPQSARLGERAVSITKKVVEIADRPVYRLLR